MDKKIKKEAKKKTDAIDYAAVKKRAMELEKGNLSRFYLYSSGAGWYKAGGTSALYYSNVLKKKNPKVFTSRLLPDTDKPPIFTTGIVSVSAIEKHIDALVELHHIKEEIGEEGIIAFVLPKKLERREVEMFSGELLVKKQKINDILMVKNSDPEIAALIREITKQVVNGVKHMSPINQRVLGEHLIGGTRALFVLCQRWATGVYKNDEGILKMITQIDSLGTDLLYVMETEALDIDRLGKIAFKIEMLRIILEKRMK